MKKILLAAAVIGAVFVLVSTPEYAGTLVGDVFASFGDFLRGVFTR